MKGDIYKHLLVPIQSCSLEQLLLGAGRTPVCQTGHVCPEGLRPSEISPVGPFHMPLPSCLPVPGLLFLNKWTCFLPPPAVDTGLRCPH